MLSLFRGNQFTVAVPLAFYVVLLHLGALLGYVLPPTSLPEGGLIYHGWFGWTTGHPGLSAAMAAALVFVQALTLHVLADEFRLMGDRNWFPGLFYVLAASALPDFQFVSAPLVAASFVPLSLRQIFRAYQKPGLTMEIFDAAFWVTVSSLFYPPALLMLAPAFIGIEVVRSFKISERLVFITGIGVPLFLGWLYYFWTDQGTAFRNVQWNGLFQVYSFEEVLDQKTLLNLGIIVLLTVVFIMGLPTFYARKGIQTQRFMRVLYWFLGIESLTVLLQQQWHWQHFLLPAATMGIFLALTFQGFRRRAFAEILHLILVAAVIFVQFADYFLKYLI